MSTPNSSDDDPPASLDDPDWVDRIVAKAMESARGHDNADPTETTSAAPPVVPAEPTSPPTPRREASPGAERRGEPAGAAEVRPPAVEPVAGTASTTPGDPRRATASADDPAPRPDVAEQARPAAARSAAAGPVTGGTVGAASTPTAGPADWPAPTVAGRGSGATSVFDQDEDPPIPLPVTEDDSDEQTRRARRRSIIEWVAVIAGAVIVAFLVKTFLLQAFYIPSSSMEPTLNINDRVLVNKLSYDFGDIERGDLVVFERPENLVTDTDDLIKRVIALPGETIELIEGRVYIDGRGLNEPYVGDLPTDWLGFDETARQLCGGDDVCTVPDDHVFVMGDNRTGSTDSRRFGPISDDSIVGRAFLRIWPLNDIGWL